MLVLSSPPPQVFSNEKKILPERHCLSRAAPLMCLPVTNEQKSENAPTQKTSLNHFKNESYERTFRLGKAEEIGKASLHPALCSPRTRAAAEPAGGKPERSETEPG